MNPSSTSAKLSARLSWFSSGIFKRRRLAVSGYISADNEAVLLAFRELNSLGSKWQVKPSVNNPSMASAAFRPSATAPTAVPGPVRESPITNSFSTPADMVCSQPRKVCQRVRAIWPVSIWFSGWSKKAKSTCWDTAGITVSNASSKVSPVALGERRPDSSGSPSAILAKVTDLTRPWSSLWFSRGLVRKCNLTPSTSASCIS